MKMKSLKMVLALVLVSSIFGGSAYAQSSVRADEMINRPQEYRLGDSNDLQLDEMHVQQIKICNDSKAIKKNEAQIVQDHKDQMQKRLLKNSDYI